ncbi:hypothetical protein GCM10022222_48590 [Amycolatopsis ultiminotia]|uniref:YggT family protein n=1 Tax=Amycolatopsis ultiminotia TaxID=543629 RepID=A0ABP6WZM3_9PSEU
MGEHAEPAQDADPESPRADPGQAPADRGPARSAAVPSRAKRAPVDWRRTREQAFSFVASLVRWIGLIFAAILVLHVIFVIGSANPANGIVSFVHSWADGLSLGFRDLFTPDDEKLRVLVNYGIAAIFWLIVSAILARILRRIGGAIS